jgi:hypothetical protein
LLSSLFASFGLSAKLDEHRLIEDWPRIVGPQIAAHTRAQEVRGKTLWVVVDSSTWLHELTLLKPLLLAKLAPHTGKAVVQDVGFVIGEVSPPAKATAVPAATVSFVTPESDAAVDDAVSALTDSELRESLRRLLRKIAADQRAANTDPTI